MIRLEVHVGYAEVMSVRIRRSVLSFAAQCKPSNCLFRLVSLHHPRFPFTFIVLNLALSMPQTLKWLDWYQDGRMLPTAAKRN